MGKVKFIISVRAIGNNLIASGVALLCGLLFAPIFFRLLGAEEFGIFGMAQLFIGTYTLLEFGAGAYVVRELAKSLTVDDGGKSARKIVHFGIIFLLLSSCAAALLLMLTALPILDIWSPDFYDALSGMVLLVAILLALTIVQVFLTSFLSGCQMQNVAAWFNASSWILRITLGWVWLTCHTASAKTLLMSQILAMMLVILVEIFYVRAALIKRAAMPQITGGFPEFGAVLKGYLRFSMSYFPATLLGFLISSLDRIILMRSLSKAEFGCFTVAKNLVNGMFAMSQSLTNYAYPSFASSLNDREALRKAFWGLQFALILLLLPTISCLLSSPDQFMALYSGGKVSGGEIAWYLTFLTVGFIFSMTGSLSQTLAVASGNERSYFLGNCLALLVVIFGWGLFEMNGVLADFLLFSALSAAISTVISLYVVEKNVSPGLLKALVLPGWILPWLLAACTWTMTTFLLDSSWLRVGVMLVAALIFVSVPNYLIYRKEGRRKN